MGEGKGGGGETGKWERKGGHDSFCRLVKLRTGHREGGEKGGWKERGEGGRKAGVIHILPACQTAGEQAPGVENRHQEWRKGKGVPAAPQGLERVLDRDCQLVQPAKGQAAAVLKIKN